MSQLTITEMIKLMNNKSVNYCSSKYKFWDSFPVGDCLQILVAD